MSIKSERFKSGLPPREEWTSAATKWRDTYAITPGAPMVQREFGYYCLEAWQEQGLAPDANLDEEFGYDASGTHALTGLGWCEAEFNPSFPEKLIEDRGEHEVVQDFAGRHVLCFKNRRSGFMPEYLDHPVKDQRTWEENVKWRLDPAAEGRLWKLEEKMAAARADAAQGKMMVQQVGGGYMYLRSLMGPVELLYAFYDQPELIHDCMNSWLTLAQSVTARHQKHVSFDEVFLAEDICYNNGPLINPEMMREFLFPYYQELFSGIRSRQLDPERPLYFQVDTDGDCRPVIDVYREVGVTVMSPFEVASGCDVVEIGKQYPWLVMSGGIDKRILAKGTAAIDRELERIIPVMRARGGYIPTCDHGVPEEVSLENYRHYRKRMLELGGGV